MSKIQPNFKYFNSFINKRTKVYRKNLQLKTKYFLTTIYSSFPDEQFFISFVIEWEWDGVLCLEHDFGRQARVATFKYRDNESAPEGRKFDTTNL